MIKNAILYRIAAWDRPNPEEISERLGAAAFVECRPTQPQSVGWIPPRGAAHGPLIEGVGDHAIMLLQVERRTVPSAAVKIALDAKLGVIERETGRRPKGKAAKELKEEIVQDLLPRAFPRRTSTLVWLDPQARLLVVGAQSVAAGDLAVTLLVEALGGGIRLELLQTTCAPATAMAHWLVSQEPPPGFTVDRETTLQQPDSEKAAVRYTRHTLDIEQVAEHIKQGKLPTKLAMTWQSRVSFVLTDTLALKGIKLLDVAIEGRADAPAADAFEADVAITTGELSQLFIALTHALGGDLMREAAPARPAAPAPHSGDDPDPLYEPARALVLEHRRASISLVQRYLQIGYNRAARLMEALEQRGVVSPMGTDGSRQIMEAA